MRITALPVFSRLADPAEVPPQVAIRLPAGWRLSRHQLATYHALGDPAVDVVINTAMTGDGKSLAGQLPLLTDPQHNGTLSLFPTNELIQDQHRSAVQTLPGWGCPAAWAGTLYGAHLDALAAEVEELRRYERCLGCVGVLKTWLTQALAAALNEGQQTLTSALLERTALPTRHLVQMARELVDGEARVAGGEGQMSEVRSLLGLETTASTGTTKPATGTRAARPVGQRKPHRDPVGEVAS